MGVVHSVTIPPGYGAGVRLTYPNGREAQEAVGAAVTYVVEEAKHPDFEREGDDLVHVAAVSLADALTECTVQVPTLDGKSVAVACDEVVRCVSDAARHRGQCCPPHGVASPSPDPSHPARQPWLRAAHPWRRHAARG